MAFKHKILKSEIMKIIRATILLISLKSAYSQSINDTCVCVPHFQCSYRGTIVEDGEGIVDIRTGIVDENPLPYVKNTCI